MKTFLLFFLQMKCEIIVLFLVFATLTSAQPRKNFGRVPIFKYKTSNGYTPTIGDNPKPNLSLNKNGFCPTVRPLCPPTRSFGPPKSCFNDYSCRGIEKCCYDVCLRHRVCKSSFGIGR